MDQSEPETLPEEQLPAPAKDVRRIWIAAAVALVLLVIGAAAFFLLWEEVSETEEIQSSPTALPTPSPVSTPDFKQVDLRALPAVHPAFSFSAEIPSGWEVEVVPGIESINIYDPAAPGATPREQSQIFLRHFSAGDFLTLSTVRIFSQEATQKAGRPAVVYDIEKLPSAANFPQQPSWRNQRHMVTDIRVSASNPSEYIVIGKRPDLSPEVFDAFVDSIQFESEPEQSLVPPVSGFLAAITLKPFGIYVTPASSPVQPERFSGYHTAADAELPAGTAVVAIADGSVVRSGRTSGYGGMVAIEHLLQGARTVAIYGHLDPASLIASGATVTVGQQIGVLGKAFSDETDGERSHLHFGLYRGPNVDIRGYVPDKESLALWLDPKTVLDTID